MSRGIIPRRLQYPRILPGSRSTPDQVLDLMEKFQAESDDGYLTWAQAKQYFSCLPGSRELFLGGAYTGTERVEKADWYDWFDRARRKYDAAGKIQEETVVVLGVLEGDENRSGDAQESAQAAQMREMGTRFRVAKRMRRAGKQSCAS